MRLPGLSLETAVLATALAQTGKTPLDPGVERAMRKVVPGSRSISEVKRVRVSSSGDVVVALGWSYDPVGGTLGLYLRLYAA